MLKRDFGSFHVSNVEELIHLPEDVYVPPELPTHVFKAKLSELGTFGEAARQKHFFLEESCTFLNHGAFGATLREALQTAQSWQTYIEGQPLRFFDRELMPHLVHISRRLSKFVGCEAADIVLVPNVTTAVNCVMRSLGLSKGDTVAHLSTEYGAVKKIIQQVCLATDSNSKEIKLNFPLTSKEDVISVIEPNLDDSVKILVIDHIPSNTPFITPVREIVQLCHRKGILVLVDGAHALGQVDLDLKDIGADFYTSNCHKWFCSVKGAAFMYVAKQHKSKIRPLIISHGYGSGFNSEFIWSGLRDYSPFLALHTNFDFWEAVGPACLRSYMHKLACDAGKLLTDRWKTDLLVPENLTASMLCVRLPEAFYKHQETVNYDTAEVVQNALYHKYSIEVPIKAIAGRLYVRISAHIHNEIAQYEKLAEAVEELRLDIKK